jgi:formylglycine-generating enzyme required for sulfatase activity
MRWLVVLAAVACVVCGCGESTLQSSEVAVRASTQDDLPLAGGSFKVSVRIPKIVATDAVRVEYVITGSGMDEMISDLTIAAGVATGTAYNVPAGTDRQVTLNAYDGVDEKTYSGSETTDVLAGETVSLSIVMSAVVSPSGAIAITGTFESTGELTVDLPGGATMEFVWIEPGTFTMGSPDTESGRGSDEGPQHEVTITQGFWLGKHEVTQGQWASVMGTTPWSGQSYVQESAGNPAAYVSWDDLQGMLSTLNAAADAAVYRLPTEAEWEYSCRAGTTTRWSFGDDEGDLGDYAWYQDNAWYVGTYGNQVGTKLPNPWGLHDMHGNVNEWVQDGYSDSYYGTSPSVDPIGPATGSSPVFRGGAYDGIARQVRSADRYDSFSTGFRYRDVGGRLLRTE